MQKNKFELNDTLNNQPKQLDLFRIVSTPNYMNGFAFYESIPRFVVGRGNAKIIKRNKDWTAAPIKRYFRYEKIEYRLLLEPAFIECEDGSTKALFPGTREMVIEKIIMKLAVDSGYFYNGWGDNKSTDNFMVPTTLYRIHKELKKRGKQRRKSKSYSYDQIREAIQVLRKTNLHIKSLDGEENMIISPLWDTSYFNKDDWELNWTKATLCVHLNKLISKSILARNWRQIDYERIIWDHSFLGGWLRTLLGLKYTYASPNKSFNIMLSTIIENSWISLYERMSDNLKYVVKILDELDDIISRYSIEPVFWVHPKTKKGCVLFDAKIIIRATKGFTTHQIQNNIHHGRLDEAREDRQGNIILEPTRSDQLPYREFYTKRKEYDQASPLLN